MAGSIKVCGSAYTPSETGVVYAQVLDENQAPANGATVSLSVFEKDGNKYIGPLPMTYIPDSNGLYSCEVAMPDHVQQMVVDVKAENPIAYGCEELCVPDWASDIHFIERMEVGRWRIVGTQLVIYDIENIVIKTFDLLDDQGNPSTTKVFERRPV